MALRKTTGKSRKTTVRRSPKAAAQATDNKVSVPASRRTVKKSPATATAGRAVKRAPDRTVTQQSVEPPIRRTRAPSATTALRLLIGSVDKLLATKTAAFQQSEKQQAGRLAQSMERIKLQTASYEAAKEVAIKAVGSA